MYHIPFSSLTLQHVESIVMNGYCNFPVVKKLREYRSPEFFLPEVIFQADSSEYYYQYEICCKRGIIIGAHARTKSELNYKLNLINVKTIKIKDGQSLKNLIDTDLTCLIERVKSGGR